MVWPEVGTAPAGRRGSVRLPLEVLAAAVWMLAAAAMIALIWFDLSPPLAFNDDWMYAWSVRQFVAGHGLHVFPMSVALALVQVVWGAIFSLGHADPRLLRLSIVPLVVLTAWCSHRLAQQLGADRFWSAVAASTLLAMPLFMANATTFMTDNAYVGLVMAVAATSLAWITRGQRRWICVGLLVLTPLQRQFGLALIPAVTLGVLLFRRESWSRADSAALIAIWTLPAVVLTIGSLLTVSQPLYPSTAADLSRLDLTHALAPLMPMLGLGLIPFAGALALRPRGSDRETAWSLAAVVLAVVGACGCLLDLARFGMIFPGNVFTPLGFAPILGGAKPAVFPGLIFQAVEIAAVVTFVMLLIVRRRWWTPSRISAGGVLLILIAASQFLPLLAVQLFIYDRYFLPVIAPLVPLVAAIASGAARQPAARGWAVGALAAGLALYVAGEQDYVAWQVARDQAARSAYHLTGPERVQAGFEANAVYVELPRYDQTGRADLFAIVGPENPAITLRFAPAADPRPGVSYSSLSAGRIVLDR
jgi:hypothetical protein